MKWQWVIGTSIVLFAICLFWVSNTQKQPKLRKMCWQLPIPIGNAIICDLDGDENDELIAYSGNSYWWLKLTSKGWKAIQTPIRSALRIVPLHFGVLVHGSYDSLQVLQYRNGWHWQKLMNSSNDFAYLDLDGDGKKNDILVLESNNVVWFRIKDDGQVVKQDEKRVLNKYSSLCEFGFWGHEGKLIICQSWERSGYSELDWDGDGISDVVLRRSQSRWRDELIVFLSGKKEQKRFIIPTLMPYPTSAFADLDGDGQRELFGVSHERIVVVDQQSRWRFIPCNVGDVPQLPKLWVSKCGSKDFLWVAGEGNLWLIWHDGKDYKIRHWKFKGNPLAIYQGKQGIQFVFWHRRANLAYEWWKKLADWLHPLGVRMTIPMSWIYFHIWVWQEKQSDWRQMKYLRVGDIHGVSLPHYFKPLDLNGDGKVEWIAISVLSAPDPGALTKWLFSDKWHLVSKRFFGILRDKHRKWIIVGGDKNLRILWAFTSMP